MQGPVRISERYGSHPLRRWWIERKVSSVCATNWFPSIDIRREIPNEFPKTKTWLGISLSLSLWLIHSCFPRKFDLRGSRGCVSADLITSGCQWMHHRQDRGHNQLLNHSVQFPRVFMRVHHYTPLVAAKVSSIVHSVTPMCLSTQNGGPSVRKTTRQLMTATDGQPTLKCQVDIHPLVLRWRWVEQQVAM